MKKQRIRRGQVWVCKKTGRRLEITRRHSGNGHWATRNPDRKTAPAHRIHEGTLRRLFDLETSQ